MVNDEKLVSFDIQPNLYILHFVNTFSNIDILQYLTERALPSLHGMVSTYCNMYNMHIGRQCLSSLN